MAAQFSGLASPETDSDVDCPATVDAIVSQAFDSATLEQIAELNSSTLPARLKSFPANEAEIIPSKNPNGESSQEQTPKHGSSSPSSPYREYSPSPPRTVCCFGCRSRSKRTTKKKDDILADLGMFSLKEQRRKLKKAMKEEMKVSREAERVVEWVKQASARMDVSAIDELLSEDADKHHK